MTGKHLKLLLSGAAIFLMTAFPVFAEAIVHSPRDPSIPPVEQAAQDAAESNTAITSGKLVLDDKKLVALLQQGRLEGVAIQDAEGIYNFYKSRNFEYFWTDSEKAGNRTDDVLPLLEDSWKHGFNPENYHLATIEKRLESNDLGDAVVFEILMSDAVARYGRDLTGMRVSAKSIGEDSRSWMKGLKAEEVLNLTATKSNPEAALKELNPPGSLYSVLQKELGALLKDMKDNPDSAHKAIAFPGLIYPHKTHPAVAIIRERFEIKPEKEQPAEFYDDKLVDRIKSFQKANGLKPDGVIGQRTIDAVNQGRRDKLIKILANLERLRWLNAQMPDKYLLVNVPAQTLWAFEGGNIKFQMPIIVGKPSWPTTSFRTDVTGIRFNPSWYVPPEIKTKDILPELQQNPDYLAKKNLQLLYYTSDGAKPVNPRDIDWSKITHADLKNFSMIQNPGDENPLGKIRVLMPNQYNIYLHDTNTPDLFTKDFRALSHGCIRLAEPKRVANFILDDKPDWNEERLNTILGKKNTIEVAAANTVPVFIVYQTIWQEGNNELIFGQDIYKNDEKLVAELAKRSKLPIAIP